MMPGRSLRRTLRIQKNLGFGSVPFHWGHGTFHPVPVPLQFHGTFSMELPRHIKLIDLVIHQCISMTVVNGRFYSQLNLLPGVRGTVCISFYGTVPFRSIRSMELPYGEFP